MRDVLQQRLVLLAQRHPVIAVHVRHVEPVAITPPDFVEDLVPLFGRHPIDDQAGGGDWLLRFVALWGRVEQTERWSLAHEHLRAIVRHRITINVIGDRGFFSILEREDFQLRGSITLSSVIESWANEIKKMPRLSGQASVIVRANRRPRDSATEAIEINHQSLLRRRRRLGFWLRRFRIFLLWFRRGSRFLSGLSYRHFVALRRKRMLSVFAQGHRIDVGTAIGRIVKLDLRDLRSEFAIADEIQIVALRIPNWIQRIEHDVSDPMDLTIRGAPDMNLRHPVSIRGHAKGEVVATR